MLIFSSALRSLLKAGLLACWPLGWGRPTRALCPVNEHQMILIDRLEGKEIKYITRLVWGSSWLCRRWDAAVGWRWFVDRCVRVVDSWLAAEVNERKRHLRWTGEVAAQRSLSLVLVGFNVGLSDHVALGWSLSFSVEEEKCRITEFPVKQKPNRSSEMRFDRTAEGERGGNGLRWDAARWLRTADLGQWLRIG